MDDNRIRLLNEYPEPEDVPNLTPDANLFFFGPHGSWKTVTACQIGAQRGKVLLYTMDGDWKSLLNHPEIERNVSVVPYRDPLQTKLVSEALRDQVPPYDQYATFVLDTLGGWVDEVIEILLNDIQYSDKNSRSRVSGKNSRGNKIIRDMNIVTPELTDFNVAKMQLRPIVRNLVNAPVNVIFNAHERNVEAGQDKSIKWAHIRPDAPESCFNTAVRKCDALGFFEKPKRDGDEATIDFRSVPNVTTKSRLDVLNGQRLKASDAVNVINNWMERVK